MMQENEMRIRSLEQQLELDHQSHIRQVTIKDNQLKAMNVAQELSKQRLQ